MKYLLGVVLVCSVFILSGCEQDEFVVYKDGDVFTYEIGDEYGYSDYIFAIDLEGQRVDCEVDDSEVHYMEVGEYEVVCVFDEEHQETFTVEVVDTTSPIVEVLDTHQLLYPVESVIDYLDNIYYDDNAEGDVTVVIDDSLVDYSTPGTYEVGYTFTDVNGNISELGLSYTLYDVNLPELDVSVGTIDFDSFVVSYDVLDESDLVMSTNVLLYKDDILIQEQSFFSLSEDIVFDDLLSDHEYVVEVNVSYVLNDILGLQHLVKTTFVDTLTYNIPNVSINNITRDLTSIGMDIDVYNPDEAVFVSYIDLYDGETLINSWDIIGDMAFNTSGLLSDHEYTFKVHYSYDLNNGDDEIVVVDEYIVQTEVSFSPTIYVDDQEATMHTILFNYNIVDEDALLMDSEITINRQYSTIETTYDLPASESTLLFEGLDDGETYLYTVELTYDLLDGNGIQVVAYSGALYTHFVDIDTITVSDDTPYLGDAITVTVTFDNPYDLEYLVATVNGQYVTLTDQGLDVYTFTLSTAGFEDGEYTIVIEELMFMNLGVEEIIPLYDLNEYTITIIDQPI
jgi:hypothetical protein